MRRSACTAGLLFLAACAPAPAASDAGGRPSAADAAGTVDGGASEPPATDASRLDAAAADAGAAAGDAEPAPDADAPDAAPADGGALDAACVATSTGAITSTVVPALLSATGLYADIAQKRVRPGVLPFEPAYRLWSDGADKARWVWLPDCALIDTRDMDHWELPVGTKLFKEFSQRGARLETRMIVRVGPGPDDFRFAQYAWNDAETDAELVPGGRRDVRGTAHDVPPTSDCRGCHVRLAERALGFGAVSLSHPGPGVTVASLSAGGRLTVPYAGYVVPGDPLTVEALGYLHANCGNCHHEAPGAIPFLTPFSLRLSTTEQRLADTGAFRTAVGVPVERFVGPGVTHRIAPGDAGASCVAARMAERGTVGQMPPIATEVADPAGVELVGRFIDALP